MNMNIVIHMTECKPDSTIASAKIARFIRDTLDFKLVDTAEKAGSYVLASIDNLIIVNGPMAFCDFLHELGALVRNAKKVIWVQQDYTIMPPAAISKAASPFRKAFADRNLRPIFWTTVKKNVVSELDRYINWNQLTWEVQPFPTLSVEPTLFYYGAYREKREKDFITYFRHDLYKVRISTTPIRAKKFNALNGAIDTVPPFTHLGYLPSCSAALYIEDAKSHTEFHSPANRFYEMISAGIPLLFDADTVPMLKQAGLEIEKDWVVYGPQSVLEKLKDPDWLQRQRILQRVRFSQNYREDLKNQLKVIWEEYNDLHSQGL